MRLFDTNLHELIEVNIRIKLLQGKKNINKRLRIQQYIKIFIKVVCY